MRAMSPDIIVTILTGIGVLFVVRCLIYDLRCDLTDQITAINTRIDNELLGGRR